MVVNQTPRWNGEILHNLKSLFLWRALRIERRWLINVPNAFYLIPKDSKAIIYSFVFINNGAGTPLRTLRLNWTAMMQLSRFAAGHSTFQQKIYFYFFSLQNIENWVTKSLSGIIRLQFKINEQFWSHKNLLSTTGIRRIRKKKIKIECSTVNGFDEPKTQREK